MPESFDPPPDGGGEPHDPSEEAFGTRRKGRRRVRRSLPGSNITHLNLTPMMDIMTMLLVFLVKSFASEPENINVNLSLRPPQSSIEKMMVPATKVTVTKDLLLVDDVEILSVPALKNSQSTQAGIIPLRDALLERASHLRAIENRGGAPFDGRLLVVADETTPYHLLTSVLVTAGEAKFSEYKLVVMQKAKQ